MSAMVTRDLRLENRRLLDEDLEERRIVPRSLPATVRFETTSICRFACLHCFKRRDSDDGVTMPMALWNRMAEELLPHVDVVQLGFGGEPLHDPHLEDRLSVFGDGAPRLDILTSGVDLAAWATRLAPLVSRLTVSVECLDADLYPMVRRGADVRSVLRGVEEFRAVAEGLPEERRPRLGFRVTLFGGNHSLLPSLVARLAQLGADEIRLVHGVALEENDQDLQIVPRRMDLAVALQRAVLQGRLEGVPVHYPNLSPGPIWPETARTFPADGNLPEVAPWARATIGPDGGISVCCGQDRLAEAVTVPLTDEGFRAAWTSAPLQEVRARAGRIPACGFCPDAEDRHG